MFNRFVRSLVVTAMFVVASKSGALAGAVVLDGSTGARYTGLVDGFPGVFPFNGVADAPDLPGVGLKAGVTEERAIAEFPLSGLAALCLSPADVTHATLTFNIDDVLASFGPGAEFNGEAANAFLIHPYSGNGAVGTSDMADFGRIGSPPMVVDTTAHGTITDSTLVATGPLFFTLDVTASLASEVVTGTHIGFVWRTTDSPTGTSLDNLGNAGQGPAGVNGSKLPFLTVTTTPLHTRDVDCAGRGATACSWEHEAGDVAYDVIRGNLSQLADGATSVDLGVVTCIENDSSDPSTIGAEDTDSPPLHQGFFYLVRAASAQGQGTYGWTKNCRQRLPAAGDCN